MYIEGAPGSRLGTERVPGLAEADREQIREHSERAAARWRRHGYKQAVVTATVPFGDATYITATATVAGA